MNDNNIKNNSDKYISPYDIGNSYHAKRNIDYYRRKYLLFKLHNMDTPIFIYLAHLMQYLSYQYSLDFNFSESRFRYAIPHWSRLMILLRNNGSNPLNQLNVYFKFCDGFMRAEIDIVDTYLHPLFKYIISILFEIIQESYFTEWSLWHYMHFTVHEEHKKKKLLSLPPIIPIPKENIVTLRLQVARDPLFRYLIPRFNQFVNFKLGR